MNEEFAALVTLIEAKTPLKHYPEFLRLCILRLRWLGIDTTKPINEADFAMVWLALQEPSERDGRWVAEAERGEVNRHIREHDEMIAGWQECVEHWNRGLIAPEKYAAVEQFLWPLVDKQPKLDGKPTPALFGEAWEAEKRYSLLVAARAELHGG